jgi:hypothetical protein
MPASVVTAVPTVADLMNVLPLGPLGGDCGEGEERVAGYMVGSTSIPLVGSVTIDTLMSEYGDSIFFCTGGTCNVEVDGSSCWIIPGGTLVRGGCAA